MNETGKFIRGARLKVGISQQTLAKRVVVSKALVCYWENGHNVVRQYYLPGLCAALELDPDAIAEFELLIAAQKPIATLVGSADEFIETLRRSFDKLPEDEQQSLVLELGEAKSRWFAGRKKKILRCICPFAGWQADNLGFKQRERIAKCIAEDANFASLESIHFVVREGEDRQFSRLKRVSEIKVRFNRQTEQRGTGHAVLQGLPRNANEPFAVFFPDDRISERCMNEMIDNYDRGRRSIVAIRQLKSREHQGYGTVDIQNRTGNTCRIVAATDHPGEPNERGQFAIIGRYLFEPRVVKMLKQSLTDTISALAKEDPGVSGYIVPDDEFETIVQTRAIVTEAIDDFVAWAPLIRTAKRGRS